MPRPNTFTLSGDSHDRDSSPGIGSADVKTITPPAGAHAVFISVETTNARATLDGSDPSVASAPSLVIPKDAAPLLVPAAPTIKWVSTAAAASVLQACWLF